MEGIFSLGMRCWQTNIDQESGRHEWAVHQMKNRQIVFYRGKNSWADMSVSV
jgi:hypothetical protein